MPQGKVVAKIKRKDGCMYFVDGSGGVREMKRGGKKKRAAKKSAKKKK